MDILKDIEKSFLNINIYDKDTDKKNAKDPFNNANALKLNEIKKQIKDYFKKKEDENNIILQKKLKYEDNYKIPRDTNNYNYIIFLEKKRELYNIFRESKTLASLHDYLKYKNTNYSHIPDVYTYEHINLEEKVRVVVPNDDNKVKVKVCKDGKVLNPITNRCVTDKTKKLVKKVDKDDDKVKVCKDGKVLNPITNRCVTDKAKKVVKKDDKDDKDVKKVVKKDDDKKS